MTPTLITAAATTGIAATTGLLALAGLTAESQLFGATLTGPPNPDQLALTFDDGPNPSATPALLALLARHHIRATFFLIGAHARREPALTREIAAAGHVIGNHTMHHPWLPRHGAAFIHQEIAACSATLEDILGQRVTLFRAPHGARRPVVLRIARSLGMTTVQWNLIVFDWMNFPTTKIYERIARGIAANQRRERGTNVVLHDGGQHSLTTDRSRTVEAVRRLLEQTTATKFVTPPDWR